MHYWHPSTLAKLYVAESDSVQFQSHLVATGSTTTSVLARWEIFRVLARKEAERMIIPGAEYSALRFVRLMSALDVRTHRNHTQSACSRARKARTRLYTNFTNFTKP